MSVPAYKTAIRAWLVASAPGTDVIYGHQNGPKPGLSFLEVRTATIVPLGSPDRDPITDATGDRESRQEYRVTLSCNAYGPQAESLLIAAREALDFETTKDDFRAAYIAVQNTGDVVHVPAVVDSQWEDRWQMDVFVGMRGTSTENTSWISGLKNATWTLLDDDGTEQASGTYDVP